MPDELWPYLVQMPTMPPGTVAPARCATSLSRPRASLPISTPPIHPAAIVVRGIVKYANLQVQVQVQVQEQVQVRVQVQVQVQVRHLAIWALLSLILLMIMMSTRATTAEAFNPRMVAYPILDRFFLLYNKIEYNLYLI